MSDDYQNRNYLSVSEAANYTDLAVRDTHGLVRALRLNPPAVNTAFYWTISARGVSKKNWRKNGL